MSQNSQKFKPGDKVRCIENYKAEALIKNKIYKVVDANNDYVSIVNDNDQKTYYFWKRFVLVEEIDMKTPHKHAELIKAWADGAEIQFRRYTDDPWKDINVPAWSLDCEYRIKPEVKPDIVRYGSVNIQTYYNDKEYLASSSWENSLTNVKATWKHDGDKYNLDSIEVIK